PPAAPLTVAERPIRFAAELNAPAAVALAACAESSANTKPDFPVPVKVARKNVELLVFAVNRTVPEGEKKLTANPSSVTDPPPGCTALNTMRKSAAFAAPDSATVRVSVCDAPVCSSPPLNPAAHALLPITSADPSKATHPDSIVLLPECCIVSTVFTVPSPVPSKATGLTNNTEASATRNVVSIARM